jgi:NADH/NAD ratio-sensing transcriptional regulator Rex
VPTSVAVPIVGAPGTVATAVIELLAALSIAVVLPFTPLTLKV